MDESKFEGSLVLESLAAIDKIDDFYDAVDSDDLEKVRSIMRLAKIDTETIAIVLKKIKTADSDH
ncbi:MAG: hypothetical protein KDD45_06190 [Bdellovibrionales bacterium]|nr:hypothetical protein [Bdellovibrionales bacterium]